MTATSSTPAPTHPAGSSRDASNVAQASAGPADTSSVSRGRSVSAGLVTFSSVRDALTWMSCVVALQCETEVAYVFGR